MESSLKFFSSSYLPTAEGLSLSTAPKMDSAGPGQKKDNAHLWEVSKGFESMLLAQLYKAMRRTVKESGLTEQSTGRKIFTEFLDAEYARKASGNAENSLAKMIYHQLLLQENTGQQSGTQGLSLQYPPAAASRAYQVQARSGDALKPGVVEKIICDASEKYGVDSALIRSVIQQESGFQPRAVSSAGAKGMMQLMDGTARDMGVDDVFNPEENIMGGVKYLRYLMDRYHGDEKLALAAYNAGPGNVDKYEGVPPFRETKHYVDTVLTLKEKHKENSQGGRDDSQNSK